MALLPYALLDNFFQLAVDLGLRITDALKDHPGFINPSFCDQPSGRCRYVAHTDIQQQRRDQRNGQHETPRQRAVERVRQTRTGDIGQTLP